MALPSGIVAAETCLKAGQQRFPIARLQLVVRRHWFSK
jgi:hypothetical protein